MTVRTRNGSAARQAPPAEAKEPGREPDVTLSAPGSGGRIEVSIWRNEVEKDNGKGSFTVFTTRMQRSWYVPGQNGAKGEFKNSQSLRSGDLLVASQLLAKAWNWIQDEGKTASSEADDSEIPY